MIIVGWLRFWMALIMDEFAKVIRITIKADEVLFFMLGV